MTYFVVGPLQAPYQIYSDMSAWDAKVPDIDRRVQISRIWQEGIGLLNPLEMPDFLQLEGHRKSLPDVFFSYGGILICSGKTRRILEEFDPGLHQFIPIRVILKSGQDAPGEHFILNVHHTLDTIIDEKTKATKFTATLPDNPSRHLMSLRLSAEHSGGVGVDKSKLTSAHLWREKAYPGIFMMSDSLNKRLGEAGIRFLKAIKAQEY
jgi:hypothetical protein